MSIEPPILPQIEAIVFDVIGTLVDEDAMFARTARLLAVESGVDHVDGLQHRWVQLLEEKMNDVVSGIAGWRPHVELVVESAREAIGECGGVVTRSLTPMLAAADRGYQAWPDVAEGIRALRAGRLVIGLSNGDLGSLAHLAAANDLAWHVVLSTAAAKTFKPAEAAYRMAIDSLALDPARTLFVAAHPWDLRAAAKLGFRTAYVSRPDAERPGKNDRFDLDVEDVLELARAVEPVTGTDVRRSRTDRSPRCGAEPTR